MRESLGAAQTAPGFFFCFRRAVDREPRGTRGIVEEAGRPPPTFTPRARPVTLGAAILDCALAFLGLRCFPEPHLLNFGKSPELRSSSISRSALFVPLLKMLRTSPLSPRTSRAACRLPRAGQRKARPEKASRGGLGPQPRRVVVSSMPILPTGRVAVE